MNKYYVSFGQIHVHRIDGITLNADCLLQITAPDLQAARQRAFEVLEREWFTVYSEENVDFEWFPRGAIIIPSISEVSG